MVAFRINLIRDSALPPESRRAVFWAMFIYLAFWGLVMVWVASSGTRALLAVHRERLGASGTEASFRAMHPGALDIAAYGRETGTQLQRAVDELDAVNVVRAKRLDLPRVLLSLTAPLPNEVNIVALDMDREKCTLVFDLVLPVGDAGEVVDVSRLITVWNSDPVLVAEGRKVSSVRSQRQRVSGKIVETWRFTVAAAGGGS
jgi:hypothetical protein